MLLDNLEYLTIQNQVTDFPKHFHETFCISLIHRGIEQIDLEKHSLFSEAGCITITNPYEIHSNPIIDSTLQIQFDTIYISKDLMKYLFNGKNIIFIDRKINDIKANQLFIQLKKAIDLNNVQAIECLLFQFSAIIKHYSQEKKEEYSELNFNALNNINDFIDNNITNKFSLDELSKIANINKYGFAKKFKASTGMSPMNYILMKKIFSSKKLITQNSELTQIAFDFQFSDMAHFSKTFKRYIGISPKTFQKSISSVLLLPRLYK
jgi:AraC-like DNA-binding protein